jgi:hypothetical protein
MCRRFIAAPSRDGCIVEVEESLCKHANIRFDGKGIKYNEELACPTKSIAAISCEKKHRIQLSHASCLTSQSYKSYIFGTLTVYIGKNQECRLMEDRMKNLTCLIFAALLSFSFGACKVNDADAANDPNTLNGDANVSIGQVGNTGSFGGATIGSKYVNFTSSMEIVKNDNGVVTVKVSADLTKDPSLAAINKWIPSSVKDSTGKISTQFKAKITSDGIQTMFLGESPHTLVKFADEVGQTYSAKLNDGVTYTRTITGKSTVDDYPYGLYNIKTMTVEQTDTKMAGIKKIVFRVNHKFGLVNITFVADDGSTASSYLYSKYTN